MDGSSNQAQKVKEALCSVGFVAKKESKPKEAEVLKREQVEEEEIVAVEDTTKLGIEDSTLPPGVPEENETALFLSIIGWIFLFNQVLLISNNSRCLEPW